MATFTSKHKNFGFYYNDQLKKFKNGKYVTNNTKEISQLRKLSGVKEVKDEQPKEEHKTEVAEEINTSTNQPTSAQ